MTEGTAPSVVEPAKSLRLVEPEPAAADIDALFRDYGAYVAAIGFRMLGRRTELDDYVQDVFLAAQRSRDGLRDHARAKAWLSGIAVNVARRRLRRRRLAARFFLDRAPEYLDVASADASPEDRLLLSRIYSALDGVPVEQRLAWSLRHLAGERLDEVALLCGCSLATAKRHIAAVQLSLRSAIDG